MSWGVWGQRWRCSARAAAAATLKLEPLEKNAYKVPLLRGLVQERLEALATA